MKIDGTLYINARFLTQKITGVQKFGIEITRRLQEEVDCVFLTPRNIIHKELANELGAVIIGNFHSHIWEQFELPLYLIKRGSPLLFNYNGMGPIFYRNKIITIHDLSFFVNPQWFSTRYSLFYKLFTSRSAKASRKIITVSNFSKKELINNLKFQANRIAVVENAVSLKKHKIISKLINTKYILTVSSLEPRKNLNRLLTAFSYLQNKNIKLVIVGTGAGIFGKDNKIEVNTNVHYWGYASEDELASLYKHALFFVFPSLYEGFGIPPLEAMYFGCPVLSSNVASLKEVCGDAAYYFNPLDTDSLTKALEYLIENKEERIKLVKKGYENVERFSWDKSVEKLLSIIGNL